MPGVNLRIEVQLNNAGSMAQELTALLGQVVRASAFMVEGHAKGFSRVDTGAMRAGWYVALFGGGGDYSQAVGEARGKAKPDTHFVGPTLPTNPLEAIIGNCVEYALYNEMGTVRMSAQPMAAPAVAIVEPQFKAAIEAAVKKAAGG